MGVNHGFVVKMKNSNLKRVIVRNPNLGSTNYSCTDSGDWANSEKTIRPNQTELCNTL